MSNQPSQPQTSSSKSVSSSKTTITDFNIHRLLGEGSYGKVLHAQSKKTNKEYAIKSIDKFFLSKLNKVHEAFIEREMLSSTLSHPNIAKLITSFQSKDKLYYVLPYYKNGSLQDLIAKNGTLPYAQAQFYLAQIVNVLEYFESKHIAHLDMKPHNILLDDDNNIKVIDFATATKIGCEYDMKRKMFVPRRSKCVDMVGTVEYAAPEMISGNVVNEKSCDLWALGVIMYQMFYGVTPFKGETLSNTKENILQGKTRFNEDVGEIVNDLIMKLLNSNYTERIGFQAIEQIKEHAFFDGVDFMNLNFQTMCCCVNAAKNKHCEHTTTCSYGSNSSCGDYCNIRETCYSDNCMDSSEEDEDKEKEKEEIAVHVVVMKGNDCEIVKMVKNVNVNNNYINLC